MKQDVHAQEAFASQRDAVLAQLLQVPAGLDSAERLGKPAEHVDAVLLAEILLAGVPESVVARAKEILRDVEAGEGGPGVLSVAPERTDTIPTPTGGLQLGLFDAPRTRRGARRDARKKDRT